MNTTTTPKVELRGVHYAAFASEETTCFRVTVYIDGKKEGEASNDGHGGCNMYYPNELHAKLEAIAKTMPDLDVSELYDDDKPHTLPQNADTFVGELLADYLEAKQIKRLCAKKTLFRIKSETYKRGEYRTVKSPFSPAVKAWLVKKYGVDLGEILNEHR